MNNTVVSVKIDKDVKQAAQAVAKNAGLNLSSLINAYLRQVVATRRIEIYSPEPMTPELEEAIAVVEAEIKAGHVSKAYDDVDELMTDLLKVWKFATVEPLKNSSSSSRPNYSKNLPSVCDYG